MTAILMNFRIDKQNTACIIKVQEKTTNTQKRIEEIRKHDIMVSSKEMIDNSNDSETLSDSSAGKCETCAHFYRDTFHATVGGGEQQGGQCFLLAEILGITNSNLWATKSIHVQETFGCVLHRDKVQ